MAGYRLRRKTKEAKFIAANSTLTLPWAYSNSTDDGTNGIFPEFFYNFANSHGFNADIGLVFRGNNGWHIFAYGPDVIKGFNGWYEKKISLSAGASVDCAVYSQNNELILKVNGVAYSIPLMSGAIGNFKKGCTVTREANLVPQSTPTDACTLLKSNAYFIGAAWSNTTLTTTGSVYEKMSTTNTTFDKAQDVGDPTAMDLNCFTHKPTTVNGYVKDSCTIDFRNRKCCLN